MDEKTKQAFREFTKRESEHFDPFRHQQLMVCVQKVIDTLNKYIFPPHAYRESKFVLETVLDSIERAKNELTENK